VPNTAPHIDSLAAFVNGIGVRRAAPGATVDVSAEVTDADGDGLHYAWLDAEGAVTTLDVPGARWTLQPVPATNSLTLLVADGRGGYTSRELTPRGGGAIARFAGHV